MSMYGSIREDVEDYVGQFEQDYDIDGIVSEIRRRGYEDIDEIDSFEFLAILMANDVTGE